MEGRLKATKKGGQPSKRPHIRGGTVVPYGMGGPCHISVQEAVYDALCTVGWFCGFVLEGL